MQPHLQMLSHLTGDLTRKKSQRKKTAKQDICSSYCTHLATNLYGNHPTSKSSMQAWSKATVGMYKSLAITWGRRKEWTYFNNWTCISSRLRSCCRRRKGRGCGKATGGGMRETDVTGSSVGSSSSGFPGPGTRVRGQWCAVQGRGLWELSDSKGMHVLRVLLLLESSWIKLSLNNKNAGQMEGLWSVEFWSLEELLGELWFINKHPASNHDRPRSVVKDNYPDSIC